MEPPVYWSMSPFNPLLPRRNTMVKTKYRNLITAQVLEKTFRSGDKVDEADFERHKGQFLYADGDRGIFMDLETYEQFELEADAFELSLISCWREQKCSWGFSRGEWSTWTCP